MIEPLLRAQLAPLERRQRLWQLARQWTACWAVAGGLALLLLLGNRLTGWPVGWLAPLVLLGSGGAALVLWWRSRRPEPDYAALARAVERDRPEVQALLRTAVELEPDPATGRLSYLQETVLQDAIADSVKHAWVRAVPARRLWLGQALHALALLVFLACLWQLRDAAQTPARKRIARAGGVTVTPGDVSLEKGSSLVVLARFDNRLPAQATLVVATNTSLGSATEPRALPLVKNLEDPVFGGSVPGVETNFSYWVEYDSKRTETFQVTVFEHPRLERADAVLRYPGYTGLDLKRIEDTRRVSAVEGTQLDLSLRLNKPVSSARLVAKDGTVLTLRPPDTNMEAGAKPGPRAQPVASGAAAAWGDRPVVYLTNYALLQSRGYQLQLVDREGRTNKVPAQFVFDVVTNRVPELKLLAPRGDQRVSPLEEITFRGETWDDFGLVGYGLSYQVGGGPEQELRIGGPQPGGPPLRDRQSYTNVLALENLALEPGQLVSYFLWAEDLGPDSQVRRTSGDMFFAEVRPFEEIFRQAQAEDQNGGEQGGGGQGSETMQLAELQKQIINATWKLQRQQQQRPATTPQPAETRHSPKPAAAGAAATGSQYEKDSGVVRESQAQALDQAQALVERATSPRVRAQLEEVEKEMTTALSHLKSAVQAPASLAPALASERAAYQALLRVAAREFQVARSRGAGGGGAGSPNQRQLEQLEFRDEQDRYETRREASAPADAQRREDLSMLNRLKELAQRQQDLNERLRELQTALQEAQSEAEREEARRQLKRLREEEQELLADLDEVRQRMGQPQNQSRMAEASEQLERTRGDVQRAANSMEEGAVSQALASGTRAQRELQDVRDQFRRQNSSQFAEEMRQMRDTARELARNQEQLGQQLESIAEQQQRSLSDSGEMKKAAEAFDSQEAAFDKLLGEMRRVSEQAETAEPLLSQKLYDALRESAQDDAKGLKDITDDLLRSGRLSRSVYDVLQRAKESSQRSVSTTGDLVQRGHLPEAQRLEQQARANIGELREDVEKAAESVLGDDTEALRLAQRELDALREDLTREGPQGPASPGDRDQTLAQGSAPQRSRIGHPPGSEADSNDPNRQRAAADRPEQSGAPGQGREARARGAGSSNENEQASQPGQDQQTSRSPSGSQQGQQGRQGRRGQQGQQGQQEQQGQQAGQSGQDGQGGNQRAGGRNFFDAPTPAGGGGGGGGSGPGGPITGDGYADWTERLRDVESLVDVPELRNEVSRVRERAREMRQEFTRESKLPQWELVQTQLAGPLLEVRRRVSEELARRQSRENLVPIDRDPVPARYSELVRRYYERLGAGQ
jgi:hypothetical protein